MANAFALSDGLNQSDKQSLFAKAKSTFSTAELGQMIATAAILPIAENVIEAAAFRKILQVDRFDNGPALPYTKKKRHTAAVLPRYGAPATFITRYTRVLVEPYIIDISPEVSTIDVRDANFNMVSDILDDAGAEMAAKEDREGFRLLDEVVPVPSGGWPANTDPITYSQGAGDIGTVLNTNSIRIGSSQAAPTGGVAGDPTVQNFLSVQAALRAIGYEPDGVLVNPYVMGKIAGQESFMLYLNFGTREVFETGMLQNALGLKLIQHRLCPQGSMYIMDTKEAARFVERDPLTMESSQEKLIMSWFLWERVCTFVRNGNAIFRMSIDV